MRYPRSQHPTHGPTPTPSSHRSPSHQHPILAHRDAGGASDLFEPLDGLRAVKERDGLFEVLRLEGAEAAKHALEHEPDYADDLGRTGRVLVRYLQLYKEVRREETYAVLPPQIARMLLTRSRITG